ncbi:NUDIX hydrolase [Magnetococcus sp. PR-3]|uniref:NUDIX hydrolase n=1 Tax=Magnetococcus sp. PR-3 TaxID=3120355 RepID=UPI002FCE40A9
MHGSTPDPLTSALPDHLPDRLSSQEIAAALQQNQPPADWSWEDPQLCTAAVVVVLMRQHGLWHTLLIQRPENIPHHPGQIGLPGGKKESFDQTPLDTALRECHEELDIPAEALIPLGSMIPYDTHTTGFRVMPLFAYLPKAVPVSPCPREVAELLTVPLHPLWQQEEEGRHINPQGGYHYHWQGRTIWGATAMILHRFFARLKEQAPCVLY